MYKIPFRRILQSLWLKTFIALAFAALVVMLLAPRNRSFQYQFSSGKPWAYELITAPYDFPIYKTDEQIRMEQDSIRQEALPVYTLDSETLPRMLNKLHDRYTQELSQTLPRAYYLHLQEVLRKSYNIGIIEASELTRLRTEGHLEMNLLGGNNILTRTPLTRFYSLKEVYDQAFEQAEAKGLSREELQRMNVSSYLEANVLYDKDYTDKLLADALSSLSTSTGIVQQGERIIDKGEIVTPYIYNVLRSLRQEQIHRMGGETQSVLNLGLFLYVALLFAVLGVYLMLFNRALCVQGRNILLLFSVMLAFIALTELQASSEWYPLEVIPYVMLVLLLRIFFDSHLALTSYLVTILVAAYFVPDPLPFLFVQLVAGFVAVFTLQSLNSRGQLIRAAFAVYTAYIGSSMIFAWIQEGRILPSYWISLLFYGVNLIFLMFTYILAFIVEKLFGYVSNVRLVELSDMATPLLKELSEVAPGTFQHSYQVSILATAAATKIGADAQLIRTGALYHDIGKMPHPEYFTENAPTNSPHAFLSYPESARIIIQHVADGVALAQKHGLPDQVIEFIRTHHGRSTTRYFYNSYCNEHPGETIDPEPFTYPGPNPYTKEMGILMLADSVEAASRSLSQYTEEGIRSLINKIVDGIVSEGLLNDTPLTFRDIQEIKEVFFLKLKTMYHARIAYPDKH